MKVMLKLYVLRIEVHYEIALLLTNQIAEFRNTHALKYYAPKGPTLRSVDATI